MDELQKKIVKFVQERDWDQFQTPKDMAISLSLEAAELLEHFQWQSPEELEKYVISNKDKIAEELSDVFYWVLLMAHKWDIDLLAAGEKKLAINASKYPTKNFKGHHNNKFTRDKS